MQAPTSGELTPSIWTEPGQAGQASAASSLFSFPQPSPSSHDTPRIQGNLPPPPGFGLPQHVTANGDLPSVDSFLPAELQGRKHSRLALWQGLGDQDAGLSGSERLPSFRDLGPSLAA